MNGKKICEGDIVLNKGDLFVVAFSEYRASFVIRAIGYVCSASLSDSWEELEIVGNAHEQELSE
jgi:hypothetical protein